VGQPVGVRVPPSAPIGSYIRKFNDLVGANGSIANEWLRHLAESTKGLAAASPFVLSISSSPQDIPKRPFDIPISASLVCRLLP
jgi:hypothetical protein